MVDKANFSNVRQLCLRLRPILGPTMDRVYEAYMAEDADGREQIEHYLELLAAKHIPQSLGQEEAELIPPSRPCPSSPPSRS